MHFRISAFSLLLSLQKEVGRGTGYTIHHDKSETIIENRDNAIRPYIQLFRWIVDCGLSFIALR